jgi:hypothetical protein
MEVPEKLIFFLSPFSLSLSFSLLFLPKYSMNMVLSKINRVEDLARGRTSA